LLFLFLPESRAQGGSTPRIEKPTGVYASRITPGAVGNKTMNGGFVRVPWTGIEPEPGKFDFSEIDAQVRLLAPEMRWSLAVHAGRVSMEGGQAAADAKRGGLGLSFPRHGW
jgi:hypothetical protein